jgi:hypothetical protein
MTKLLAQIDFDKVKVPASGGLVGSANAGSLTIGEIIGKVFTTYVFYAAGIALLLYLILGGFQFMLSRGDPKAAQAAQSKITNAVIGFVIVFLAYIIVQLVAQLFGLKGTIFGEIFN